jgi:hypothetical protein
MAGNANSGKTKGAKDKQKRKPGSGTHPNSLKTLAEVRVPFKPGEIQNPLGIGGFQKGVSGNPSTELINNAKLNIRQKYMPRLPEVMDKLFEHLYDSDAKISVLAGKEISDRLIGRPTNVTEEGVEGNGIPSGRPSEWTQAQIVQFMLATRERLNTIKGENGDDVIEGKRE